LEEKKIRSCAFRKQKGIEIEMVRYDNLLKQFARSGGSDSTLDELGNVEWYRTDGDNNGYLPGETNGDDEREICELTISNKLAVFTYSNYLISGCLPKYSGKKMMLTA
jgi:hypothetical protein